MSGTEATAGVIIVQNSAGGSVVIDVGPGAPLDLIAFADGSAASLGEILAHATTSMARTFDPPSRKSKARNYRHMLPQTIKLQGLTGRQ